MITNSSAKLFSFLAAFLLLLQSNSYCWAKNISLPIPSSDNNAILGLDVAPSSLPTIDNTSGGALVAAAIPQAMPSAGTTPALPSSDQASRQLGRQTQIAAAQPSIAADNLATLRGGINVSPSVAETRVDDLTRQILLKIIELERFNLHYTLEVARQGRWKAWRYGGLQEVNASMGLAGAIVGVAERGSHIHSPQHVHNELQEVACYVPMIGSIIGATAAAMEFGINEYHDIQAANKGFSPSKAVAHVSGLNNDINKLLAERDALTAVEAAAPSFAGHVAIDQAEGRVLHDLRDEALQEFERFHIGARKLLAFQQCQYLFDLTKYSVNALGYEYAYESLHRHRRYFNLRAGVCWDVAGPLYMTGPIISRVFAKGVGELHRKRLRPTTQEAEAMKVEQLVADHAALDHLISAATVSDAKPAVERAELYGSHEKTFQDEIRGVEKNRAKSKLSATQNIGGGLFVGSLKLAQGILFTIPGGDHKYNVKTFQADRVTNTDLFVGSVISIPAGVYSIADTLRIQIRGEIDRHRLAKAGMLPRQLMEARLAQLDHMEARLKAVR